MFKKSHLIIGLIALVVIVLVGYVFKDFLDPVFSKLAIHKKV